MSSTIRRPDLHYEIHKPIVNQAKRIREEDIEEDIEEEEWDTEDETSEDSSDYSMYSDDDESVLE